MRAVGYQRSLPPTDEQSLVDIELPDPVATGRDLLVSVRAVAVNPVDTKIRRAVAAARRRMEGARLRRGRRRRRGWV